eukprot:7391970-Prymnesium_polylepis.3
MCVAGYGPPLVVGCSPAERAHAWTIELRDYLSLPRHPLPLNRVVAGPVSGSARHEGCPRPTEDDSPLWT